MLGEESKDLELKQSLKENFLFAKLGIVFLVAAIILGLIPIIGYIVIFVVSLINLTAILDDLTMLSDMLVAVSPYLLVIKIISKASLIASIILLILYFVKRYRITKQYKGNKNTESK